MRLRNTESRLDGARQVLCLGKFRENSHEAVAESGTIHFAAVMLLALLTVLGISISSMSTTELQIARNEADSKQAFYTAEGDARRAVMEIRQGAYPIDDVFFPKALAAYGPSGQSSDSPYRVFGEPYAVSVTYLGVFPAPKGFSSIAFSRYDYEVQAGNTASRVRVRCARIGRNGP